MWKAFKEGYYEAGGVDPFRFVAIVLGTVAKGATYAVGAVIALRLMGVL